MTSTIPVSVVVGASSGIGRSLAYALARDRQRVGLVARRAGVLEQVARHVTAFGGEPLVAVSDVQDTQSIREAIQKIVDTWGTIDTIILSSGIALATDPLHFETAPFREIIETNLLGVANWIEALQPVLAAQPNGGTIAVLSSLSARRAVPGAGTTYSASKAAASQLCDGLRAPFATQNIRLVTIEPGFVRTNMTSKLDFLPALVEPEDAAGIILKGLRNKDRIIRFPLMATLTMDTLRLLPPSLLDLLYRKF
jgi:NADP-dependent 3-hydroxy acid dehydrogenase YdfG